MKKFILAIAIALVSTASFADVIAKYSFTTVDGENRGWGRTSYVSYEVELNDDATLTVKSVKTAGGFVFHHEAVEWDEETKELSPAVYALLLPDAQSLSTVKLKEWRAQVVCMMMPSPEMSNNYLSVKRGFKHGEGFTGKLETVDSPSGCWLAHQIHPETEWGKARAQMMKRSLKLLAL